MQESTLDATRTMTLIIGGVAGASFFFSGYRFAMYPNSILGYVLLIFGVVFLYAGRNATASILEE